MTRLRVAFVCQWYAPEPILQPGWIVEALRALGADLTVMTAVPNYPTGKVAAGYSPWRPRTERMDGVTVHRAPVFPSHDRGAVRRMLNYASWALSSSLLARRLSGADVTLVYSSPATAALAAMTLKRLLGTPYVLLVQDVWPDSVASSGFLPVRLGAPIVRLIDLFVDRTYRSASAIAVISPGMIELLAGRGVPEDKLALVHNWVRDAPADDSRTLRSSLGLGSDDFVLLYAGNHGVAQQLGPVVDAFLELPATDACHLVLVGDGVEKAQLQKRGAGSAHIHFLPPVPAGKVASFAAEADAQLVALADEPLFRVTMPSKLQAIMAAGKPVLAVARGDVPQVVTQAGAGATALPGDRASIGRAVQFLRCAEPAMREDMGRRARAYYEEHMSERVGAGRLRALLDRAAGESSASPSHCRSRDDD